MDVDRVAVDGALVREDLHAVDQRDDAVRLVGDQPGECAVLVGHGGLQQLGGAANAGKRVLDLVGEHGGQTGHRARRAAVGHLAVDLVRHRALLEHHDDRAGHFRHGHHVDVDQLVDAKSWRRDVDAVFVDRRPALPHLVDQGEQRAAEGHEPGERAALQHGGGGSEEILRVGIGEGDGPFRAYHDDRVANRVQHDLSRLGGRQLLVRGRQFMRRVFLSRRRPGFRRARRARQPARRL